MQHRKYNNNYKINEKDELTMPSHKDRNKGSNRVLDLFWHDNIWQNPRPKMRTVSRFFPPKWRCFARAY